MLTGEVRYFNRERGYGFLRSTGNKDYFFHYTEITDPPEERPQPGEVFLFDVGSDRRGEKAVDLKKANQEAIKNEISNRKLS